MKKLWYIMIFILILNHTNISIGITLKVEKGKCFLDTIYGCPNLDDSIMESWMRQSPETGTALKHRDGAVFLDVARGTPPGTPRELSNASVPLQVRKMLPPLLFSRFLLSCYP